MTREPVSQSRIRALVAGPRSSTRPNGAMSPSGVAVTPDGRLILTADRDDDQVSIIDAATLAVGATVKVGTRPFGVTVDADGRRAYTANVGSNDVTVIDVAGRRVVGTVPVGERPYAVALSGGRGDRKSVV